EIPVAVLPDGGQVKVIAGVAIVGSQRTAGPINSASAPLSTDPLYLDITLTAGARFEQAIPAGHNAFLYVYEGEITVDGDAHTLMTHAAGILDSVGDAVEVRAGKNSARLLLIAGKPLNEPVVQYGPFVMNSREEIEQAIRDYQLGKLVAN
ncbi:MAG: pirin family protein, partial [Gammaproteobacteria bacterium]